MHDKIEFTHLKNILTEYAMALQSRYKDNLLSSDRIASGDLIKSVQYKLDFNDRTFIVSLELENYWRFIEYDTKPHFPPVDAILRWIKVKPILPHPDKNGKLPTPNQLAYLIGNKISEEGTQGTNDLERTLEEMNNGYKELIEEALYADINDSIDEVIMWLYKP